MLVRNFFRWFIVVFTLAFYAVFAAAQEPVQPKLTPRIITATRQVNIFSALEKQLLTSVQKKDQAGLSSLLAEDFTIEMPDADPVAGEDWVPQVMDKNYSLQSFVIRQMSAADMGNAVLVKFSRILHATLNGTNKSGEFFVVDLWRKSGDSWKLANRYVTRVGDAPASDHPKPSGKE